MSRTEQNDPKKPIERRPGLLSLRIALLKALRRYAQTSLRGRSRLISFLHPRLCPPSKAVTVTIQVGGVPFTLDLTERSQINMYYGAYEPNEIAFLQRVLQPNGVFVDVGANVGYYSAVAASCVGPAGTVHAFEPVPHLFSHLERRAELAARAGYHILPMNIALSNRGGETIICVSKGSNIGWSTIVPGLMNAAEVKEQFNVPVMRLDQYFARGEYCSPDVVKMDVEAAEPYVIEGMSGLFEAGVYPVLLVEVRDRTADHVRDLLITQHGYEAFRCLPGGRLERIERLYGVKAYLVVFLPR